MSQSTTVGKWASSRASLLAGLVLLTANPVGVQANPVDAGSGLLGLGGGAPQATSSAALRKLILTFLPDPLYQDQKHWGLQKSVTRTHWAGKGFDIHQEKKDVMENDGLWWRVKVKARQPDETLLIDLRDVQTPEPGRTTFTAIVALDLDVDYDRERWNEGTRLFAASLRGRLRVIMTLQCEATTRTEQGPKQLFPDTIFRLRVVKADCRFENLVIEHIAGVGGDAAKLFGETGVRAMHRWRPGLEKRLLERADAAIVKAGDTKDIRIGLSRFFGAK